MFRDEALKSRNSSFLGRIALIQPLKVWVLTLACSSMALVVIAFLLLGSYTRRSSVTGQLVAAQGIATVLAPVTGIVTQITVEEGNPVNSGQALAMIAVPRTTLGSGNTSLALELQLQQQKSGLQTAQQAQQQQLASQAEGLNKQLASAKRELQQIEAEINTRQNQIKLANEKLSRLQELEREKFVSALQINEQQSLVLEYTVETQTLQRQAISSRRLQAQLQQALLELPSQRETLSANYTRELAQLEQQQVETEARNSLVITAPVDGVIATQLVKHGQAVQVGQPLLSLLPGQGELQAQLIVPSRAIGFIEPGDKVILRYQAFPYQKFGHHQGIVDRISRSALSGDDLHTLLGSTQISEPMYRITVNLPQQFVMAYGENEQLKPGMMLDADILGEKRKLIEWIFEPFYSINGRIGNY